MTVLQFIMKRIYFTSVFAVAVLTCQSAAALTTYRVTDIGSIGNATTTFAVGINDFGRAIGYSMTSGGERAFISDYGVITPLPDLPGGIEATIVGGINNSGQVAGTSFGDNGERAVLWDNGSIINLGTLPGDDRSAAIDINDAGQIIGSSWSSSDPPGAATTGTGFFWDDGVMTPIALVNSGRSFRPRSINELGQVGGIFYDGPEGAVWDDGNVTQLPFGVSAINNGGLLGTYGAIIDNGTFNFVGGRVNAFNEAGQAVGSGDIFLDDPPDCFCAFLWDAVNGVQVLVDSIHASDPYANTLTRIWDAHDINERGEIAVSFAATDDGINRGLILTPVPVPGVAAAFPLLLAALHWRTRRHRRRRFPLQG